MRLKLHRLFALSLVTVLLAQCQPAAQDFQQPDDQQSVERLLDPVVARLRGALALNEEQTARLRQILDAHKEKILELRRRAQAQPFSPQLPMEADREQRAIREELMAHLTDEQKSKVDSVNLRLPIPVAPPFVPINISPRAARSLLANDKAGLASAERLVPQVAARDRNGRLTEDQKALHLLSRITYGPRPGDLDYVKKTGVNRFLEEQLHPESVDDAELEKRLTALPTLQMTAAERYQLYPPPQAIEQRAKQENPPAIFGRPQQVVVELIQQKLVRAVSSSRQLEEVMTDFWFNHFNVFAQKEAALWMVTTYERDTIRPNAMGKFRDLLTAVAESPAMLYYLDNWLSSSPDSKYPRPPAAARPQAPARTAPNPQPPRRPGLNENYARELLELHTLGVEGGYTQKDVQEVARAFTGWTIDRPFQGGGFTFRPWMHDAGAKTVLGVTIPAGGRIGDGRRVIEILSRHTSTARFISKKLCQRFVSDNPPAQLVERAAQVFLKSDGDIREVLRAILTSQEFYSASSFRSKVKSPLELVASALRAVEGDTNGAPALHEWLRKMGGPLYLNPAPTGYDEDSKAWVNTGVFFNRINFAVAFANGQIPGTTYEPESLISPEEAASADEMTNKLVALIVHTELSAESLQALRAGLAGQAAANPQVVPVSSGQANTSPARRRIAQAVGLLLGTAEFQRR